MCFFLFFRLFLYDCWNKYSSVMGGYYIGFKEKDENIRKKGEKFL